MRRRREEGVWNIVDDGSRGECGFGQLCRSAGWPGCLAAAPMRSRSAFDRHRAAQREIVSPAGTDDLDGHRQTIAHARRHHHCRGAREARRDGEDVIEWVYRAMCGCRRRCDRHHHDIHTSVRAQHARAVPIPVGKVRFHPTRRRSTATLPGSLRSTGAISASNVKWSPVGSVADTARSGHFGLTERPARIHRR